MQDCKVENNFLVDLQLYLSNLVKRYVRITFAPFSFLSS